ncbi:DNA methyltransferase [Aquirhabdus sp.]|uniref:DNA methyltransferase n=1 Tax=Aquirhabdus sp. TaxID=2824160 RepID=UPI00396C71AC
MATNKRVANRQHRWLSSVEITGVVLSEPVLADAGNFRSLDKQELATFRKQREIWNLPKGMVEGNGQPGWLNFILEDFLGLKDKDYWQVGAAIPANMVVNLPEQQERLRPSRVLLDEGKPIMLVLEVPREQSLDKPWLQNKGRWKASPTTKSERLLRDTGIELGLLTNGEAWRLVVASPSETTSWMTWTSQTWNDDPLTLAAFKDLLGESRFFAGPRDQGILELIKLSRQRQMDVADQLGNQVREALQILVHELDRIDAELSGDYLHGYSEAEIFESSVAFIMRLLFTLYAEENGLLPHGNVSYDRAYGVLHLLTELEETKRLAPEKLKHSFAAYARLLASSRLLHDGSIDQDIRIAAHGGQLFDPNRYPLLDGRNRKGIWPTEVPEPPKVRDAVIRDILRSLKYAKADGVRQLVSYRTLSVEQIGHMYEGLLDRRVTRAPANKTQLLLQGGSMIAEPEPMDAADFAGLDQAALIKAIAKYTSKTAGTIKKVLEREEERHTLANLGTDDTELLEQAKPVERFLKDLGIVRPGGLYVTHGQDRRSSGAHYTPPTLTEPVVRRTLEHQVYVNIEGKPGLLFEPKLIKTPQEILSLKVCDPAMGSGAFLVQATRYLAERLVDAWERISAEQPDAILTMPFAIPSKGEATENLMPESREERIVFARRYVAERCIYGVDMNRLAVEMAKLSLWLTTLSTDRPFTFVDHALKHGNSLIGLTPEQIREFTWKPITNDFGPLFESHPEHEIVEVERHREAIHNIPDHDFVSKEKENRLAEDALDKVRLKAILGIAAFFDGKNTKQREANLINYRYWFDRLDKDETAQQEVNKIVINLGSRGDAIIPFCWEAEFPEIFYRKNKGFDALIGNPPFLGGKKISTVLGKDVADYLDRFKNGKKGACDLVTFFLIRCVFDLLCKKNGSSIGLITTNTISQGDTRELGLLRVLRSGFKIYHATPSMKWPGKANVTVSILHVTKMPWAGKITLGLENCDLISSYLDSIPCNETPAPIMKNAGLCGTGVYVYGAGFVLSIEEANEFLNDPESKKVIKPYLVGDDINNTKGSIPSRYCIDFGDLNFDEAKKIEKAFNHITTTVKPERDKLKGQIHEKRYWVHWDRREDFFNKLRDKEFYFGRSRVSNLHLIEKIKQDWTPSDAVVIFATDKYAMFGVLQSIFHQIWAERFSTTMKNDLRYSISDSFDNFPFPNSNEMELIEYHSKAYYLARKRILDKQNLSLRELQKKADDEACSEIFVQEFRDLTITLNKHVAKAYGFENIDLEFSFRNAGWLPQNPHCFTISMLTRDEIIKRLLERHSMHILGKC